MSAGIHLFDDSGSHSGRHLDTPQEAGRKAPFLAVPFLAAPLLAVPFLAVPFLAVPLLAVPTWLRQDDRVPGAKR